jgi:hypothetical protein
MENLPPLFFSVFKVTGFVDKNGCQKFKSGLLFFLVSRPLNPE